MIRTALFCILLATCAIDGSTQDVRNVNWGMSMEQVRSKETASYLSIKGETMGFRGQVEGADALILYKFKDNKLQSVRCIFQQFYTEKNDFISAFKSLEQTLSAIYGAPFKSDSFWQNDRYRQDSSQHGLAVSLGDLDYVTRWDTPTTTVLHVLMGQNGQITHGLDYTIKQP